MCIVPVALVVAREDMRLTENGCDKKNKRLSIPPIGVNSVISYDATRLIIRIIVGEHIFSEPFVQW